MNIHAMSKASIALALVLFLLTPGALAQTPPPPVKATPANAAAFVGDWDLSGEGSNGPASFALSIKVEGEKLTAVLMRGDTPQGVNEISMVGPKLSLDVEFYNAGASYPAVIVLTPSADKVLFAIDAGVGQMDGTATKKAKT